MKPLDLRRATVGLTAAACLVVPLSVQCGGNMPNVPGVDIPGAGKCPDMANVDALADFDWAGAFKIDAKLAGELKGGVVAAVELQQFAASIDADLKTGCGGLAKDLGGTGDYKSGEEACKAAAKAVGDFKAKLGAKASCGLDVDPPKCGASLDAYAKCEGKCDANFKPGEAKIECEPGKLQGECSGQCEGSCEASGGAKCQGECNGKCDATLKGKCAGTCDGKCDGKPGKAECKGTCEGKCDAEVKGECSGSCSGGCQMKAKAECKGTCTGSCSVEMKAPKCTGQVKPPQASAECNARCDAHASAHVECTPAHVVAKCEGAADAKLQAQLKGAVEKNFPVIAKIALGMPERAPKVAANVEAMVKGVQSSVQGVAGAGVSGAALAACVAAPFKGALEAAAGVTANVQASVSIKASVEAKGSASAGTK